MSLGKIASGTAFLSIASIVRILSQVAVLPIMARLLGPSDYGLVAIIMPFIVLSMLVSDGGLGSSLVRADDDDPDIWATGFWMAAMLGGALGGVLMLSAMPVAWLYGDARLTPLMVALAFVVVLQSLVTIPGAALQKQGRFAALGLSEAAAVAAGLCVMLTIASHGGGAWALVSQQLTFWVVRLVLTASLSPFRPRLVFDVQRTWSHVIFGRDTIGSSLVGFLSRNLDALVIGKVLGFGETGLYSLAMQFARLPFSVVGGPLYVVAYSHISQSREDRALVRATFLAIIRVIALVLIPALGMLATFHDALFHLLLSSRWTDASPLFMLLAPACGLQALTMLSSCILVAYGRTMTQMRMNAEFALLWILMLSVSVSFGIHAVAVSYCVSVILFFPRTALVSLAIIECPVSAYASALAIPMAVTLAAAGGGWVLRTDLAIGPAWQLGLAAVLMGATIATTALIQLPTLRAELRLMGSTRGGPPRPRPTPDRAPAPRWLRRRAVAGPLCSTGEIAP